VKSLALLFAALVVPAGALAATPQELLAGYVRDARNAQPAFEASPARGAAFFGHRFNVSAQMPGCSSCHTESPTQPGRHAITGKLIKPLAPGSESTRFTDNAKVEKWFRRNCSEVVGRECTAAEKADFLAYLKEPR
jgi:hypothetical protein